MGNRFISGNPEVRDRDRFGVEPTQRSRRPGSGNRRQSSAQVRPAAWGEPGGDKRRLSETATAGEQARAGQGPQWDGWERYAQGWERHGVVGEAFWRCVCE